MTKKGKEEGDKKNKVTEEGKNPLEWTVFAASLFIVISILGYLAYKVYSDKAIPADIQIEYAKSPTETAPYRYHIEVKNIGGETAENVLVELVQKDSSKVVDKAEIEMPFVPQSSNREGWVNFSKNPTLADTVIARVISFKKP